MTGRISPIFIENNYQNRGFAKLSLIQLEEIKPEIQFWQLDTIKQEPRLLHLYKTLGYKPTGKEEKINERMTILYLEKRSKYYE